MWPSTDWITIGGGAMELKLRPGYQGFAAYSGGSPKEFDACVDIIYPEAKKPDGGTFAGIAFWFKDYDNYYAFGTTPVGAVGAFRMSKGKFAPRRETRLFTSSKGCR